jgi:pilus assembly protein CpaE
MHKGNGKRELTALAVLPDRALEAQFSAALADSRGLHVLASLKAYPSAQVLDVRVRQLRPDVVVMDLSADPDLACQLIAQVAGFRPPVLVIALDARNSPDTILRSVRAGATEFLSAPFARDAQVEVFERIRGLLEPEDTRDSARGQLVVFSSVKPGSGASTLASQTAFAIERLTGKRVLLADLDCQAGALNFFLKLRPRLSIADLLTSSEHRDPDWTRVVISKDGVDVLPAPEQPAPRAPDPARVHELLEFAQASYDWVVADAPNIFERSALLSMSNSDRTFLVTTAELPSLHLARKATGFLTQLGLGTDRYQVLVNRLGRKDGINPADMAKIFNAPMHAAFPNDYGSLHGALAEGAPLRPPCPLGKSIEQFAAQVAGVADKGQERRKTAC